MAAEPGATVAVAFSGGRDSLALLHATCRAATAAGLQVVALHVHHGLQPEADGWVRQAQQMCRRWHQRGWPVSLRWGRLDGQPAPGQSVEAWARNGRYALLARLAQDAGAGLVLLAQHRRDQAETVLLQALRGGGPAGLSAMPVLARRQGLVWARPWLAQPREAIEAYLRRHRLKPLEDPSNLDPRWARNRLRLQVWPALQAAFPDAESALAGAALRAQEAQAVLVELAALDLAPLVDDEGGLQVAGWRQLTPARQANALRAWWSARTDRGPTAALVQRLLAEVPACGSAGWPAGEGQACELYRGRLHWRAQPARVLAAPRLACVVDLSRPGTHRLPAWGGVIVVRACAAGSGVAVDLLRAVSVRARCGGERFQVRPGALPRSLKLQFQAAAVPVAGRQGPLLWTGKHLLFVPGLGLDARCTAQAGANRAQLIWQPDVCLSGPVKYDG